MISLLLTFLFVLPNTLALPLEPNTYEACNAAQSIMYACVGTNVLVCGLRCDQGQLNAINAVTTNCTNNVGFCEASECCPECAVAIDAYKTCSLHTDCNLSCPSPVPTTPSPSNGGKGDKGGMPSSTGDNSGKGVTDTADDDWDDAHGELQGDKGGKGGNGENCRQVCTCAPTEAPTDPTEVPIAPTDPTEVPIDPTEVPISPTTISQVTEAPVTPTDVLVTPTKVPVTPTDAPVTPTKAPVTPTDAPVIPTKAPVTPTKEPTKDQQTEPPVTPSNPDCISTCIDREGDKITVEFVNPDPLPTDWVGIYKCKEDEEGNYNYHPEAWLWTCNDDICPEGEAPKSGTLVFEDPLPSYNDYGPHSWPLEAGQCYVALLNRNVGRSPPPYDMICEGLEWIL